MMARRLAVTVHVVNESGEMKAFGPGSASIPKWARDQITNPDAWAGDDTDEEVVKASPVPAGSALERPPTTGEGSGLDKWVAHAESLGIIVPEGATRADVITLVDAADETK